MNEEREQSASWRTLGVWLLVSGAGVSTSQAQSVGHSLPGESIPEWTTSEAQRAPERLALHAAKVITLATDGDAVIDDGVVVIEDGRILEVGPSADVEVPEGCEYVELGDRWLMPGLVELHCHIGAPVPFDINEAVYLANPGLRASCIVRPDNALMRRGVAGGVTTALFIPGSGSNMGGQGVLLKLGHDTYEEMELRNPGALKLAQAGNPESWTVGVARTWMNWNTRNTLVRGLAYAHAWERFEEGEGERPQKDIQWEVFRSLAREEAQVAAHTQLAQVVGVTISMVAVEMGLDVFIDHGSLGGHHMAAEAEKHGVAAILGPRTVAYFFDLTERAPQWGLLDTKGAALGIPAEYQRRGHTSIGFNTDCVDGNAKYGTPPQEELSLQAAMALRYGMTNHDLESLRGLTIVPAQTIGLGDRLGSLEPGKDADMIVITGDIADPRTFVERAYTDGELVYDAERDGRRW